MKHFVLLAVAVILLTGCGTSGPAPKPAPTKADLLAEYAVAKDELAASFAEELRLADLLGAYNTLDDVPEDVRNDIEKLRAQADKARQKTSAAQAQVNDLAKRIKEQ